ncbi:tRNA (5-methylaminomethyl-2-thiouridine)(34)-methyltransferase MnmD [Fulvivirga lutea]|uniref:tRNA (5-methylaminomethyl-2-thiouridine)(34)-methyltransferase MnmD n=1 Tax=Fulvivirga lutea TaxID=2810512 RepID=A0A975A140_9BACT|nr:tRNA (5-methylaminomethyl-2-thiouridine)(34)-methyltransferase MnmD [Fulvivirga lutea]QSE97896.1 tRNA (5-methylaminomethyl-2-thiouridine)(34)-methyltransferase MnmD [Fulvivirga lutea]
MSNDHLKIITTEDGSHSLYNKELNETYHSFHGALQESRHVFIENGLRFWHSENSQVKKVKIFELGFGTGLNALLSLEYGIKNNIEIEFMSIEAYPLDKEQYEILNYSNLVADGSLTDFFNDMHEIPWNSQVPIHEKFLLEKIHDKIELIDLRNQKFDIVFYDAFAPSKQPQLWEIPQIEKVVNSLKKGGVFVTYCAQGQLKRNLKSLGLEVNTLPGPPGKKEMVMAIK